MSTSSPDSPSGLSDLLANLNLKITYLPTASLTAVGRKSRTHSKEDIRMIAESIRTFGFLVPVIVDEENKVLAGNARIDAARDVGLDRIPTVKLSHLTPQHKQAFVIAENQLATLAGWDKDVLRIEFVELSEIDLDFSLEVTGFVEPQIDAIMFGKDLDRKGDELPAVPQTPVSRVGDLWLLGKSKLLCGDATEPASFVSLLAGEQARAVFTDPPYNVKIAGHVTGAKGAREFVMA